MSFVRLAILKHGRTEWDQALLPKSEVARRLDAIRALMAQQRFDALVVYSDQLDSGDVAYLTNFHSYEPRHPALAVVTPAAIDLIPKVAARDDAYIRLYSWAEVHECEGTLAESLAAVAQLRGLERARVGFVGLPIVPPAGAEQMQAVFAAGSVVDAGDLVRQLRREKSPAERTLMRVAAEKAQAILASLAGFVRPGMSELEAAAFADYAARSEGCMDTDVLVARTVGAAFPFVPAEPRGLALGSVFNVYLAVQYHGYWVEASDPIPVGEITAEQFDGQRIASAYLQQTLDAATPVPPADGRFAVIHGVGLDREEAPLPVQPAEPLRSGDVVGVHVGVERGGTLYVCGRTAAVDGPRLESLA